LKEPKGTEETFTNAELDNAVKILEDGNQYGNLRASYGN